MNSINIDKIKIKREETSKYLGIILDETLSFKPHITELISKLTKITNWCFFQGQKSAFFKLLL